MYNKTILMGRIVNDLELKATQSGTPVLSFRIAVDRKYQADKNNKVSDFFNIVAWRTTAEFISRFYSKGRMILVEGELQNRSYTDKNGSTQWVTELIVDSASFTGEKAQNTNGDGANFNENTNGNTGYTHNAQNANQGVPAPVSPKANVTIENTDEEYPF